MCVYDCVSVLTASAVATSSLYVMDSLTLLGVNRSVFTSSNIASAVKVSLVAHIQAWGFTDVTTAMVSVLTVTDTVANGTCVLPVSEGRWGCGVGCSGVHDLC